MQAPQCPYGPLNLNNSMRPIQYIELRLSGEVVGYAAVDTHKPGIGNSTSFEVVGCTRFSKKLVRFEQAEVKKHEFDTFVKSLKAVPEFEVIEFDKDPQFFVCGVKVRIPKGVPERTPSVEMHSLRYKEEGKIRRIRRRIHHLFRHFR